MESDSQEDARPNAKIDNLTGITSARMAAKQMLKKDPKSTMSQKAMVAQARMKPSKLTGRLFNLDIDCIPDPLKPTFQKILNTSESMEAQIQTFRPALELLIYWENFTNTLVWTLSIILTFVIAKLGFSFGWIVLILAVLGGAFKRNLNRLRRKIRHELTNLFAIKKMDTDKETVEWLNSFLGKFWLNYEPVLSQNIADSINGVLEVNKPNFLDDLRMTTFTLGSEAPRIEAIRTYPKTEDDILMMDWDLAFQPFDEDDLSRRAMSLTNKSNSKIEITARIGKGVASIPLPIVLKEVEFQGTMRVQIKFSTVFPHIKSLEFGFVELPKIDFILRPLKGMDLMDTPGLSNFLDETIKYQLQANIVDPNRIVIPLEEWMGAYAVVDQPVGVLCVTCYEGKGLKNVELTGKSDPYVKVYLGDKVAAKTKAVDNTLAPFWNETHYIIIYNSTLTQTANKSDQVYFEVMDHNANTKDKSMGLTKPLILSNWLKLLDKPKPSIPNNDNNQSTANEPNTEDKPKTDEKVDDASQTPENPVQSDPIPDLTLEEKQALLSEWGSPNEPLNVWAPLFDENTDKNKRYGDIRVGLSYYALPDESTQKLHQASLLDPKTSSEIPTGILTVTVHQCLNLAVNAKTGNPFVIVEMNNNIEVAKSKVKKKTNSPVWDESFDVFVTDIDAAKMTIKVRDNKELGHTPLGHCVVNVKETLCSTETSKDWFKLFDTSSGKIRCSFKFTAIPLQSSSSKSGPNLEPHGFLKLTLVEAKNVLNVEVLKKSDPFVKVKLSGLSLGQTNFVENTLDPQWNHIFYTNCYSFKTDHFHFEVLDFNEFSKNRSLGVAELLLAQIIPLQVVNSFVNTDKEEAETQSIISSFSTLAPELAEKYKKDGLKIVQNEMHADVWCPIYVTKGKDIVQKGHLHFIVEYFPTVASKAIRPIKNIKNPAKDSPDSASPDSSFFSKNADLFDTFTMGVLSLKIHEARGFVRVGNFYISVQSGHQYGKVFTSSIIKNSIDPFWNDVANLFVDDLMNETVIIQLQTPSGDEPNVKNDEVLGIWRGYGQVLKRLIGNADEWLNFEEQVEGQGELRLRVSIGYFPVTMDENSEIGGKTGTLMVEIVEAKNLEAVDSGGTSDPYCCVSLNGDRLHKTKVVKKNLNPVFQESCKTKLTIQKASLLLLEIYDYNKFQKHVLIGSVSIPLISFTRGEKVSKEYPLEHARSGRILLNIQFEEDDSSKRKNNKRPSVASLLPENVKVQVTPSEAGKGLDEKSTVLSENTANLPSRLSSVSCDALGKNDSESSPTSPARRLKSLSSKFSINSIHGTWEELNNKVRSRASTTSVNSVVATGSLFDGHEYTGDVVMEIIKATNLKSVDSNGLSDPYIKVMQTIRGKPKQIHKTAVVKKTLSPIWEKEKFEFKIPPSRIKFIIKDYNKFGDNLELGELDFDVLSLIPQDLLTGVEKGDKKSVPFETNLALTIGNGQVYIKGTINLSFIS